MAWLTAKAIAQPCRESPREGPLRGQPRLFGRGEGHVRPPALSDGLGPVRRATTGFGLYWRCPTVAPVLFGRPQPRQRMVTPPDTLPWIHSGPGESISPGADRTQMLDTSTPDVHGGHAADLVMTLRPTPAAAGRADPAPAAQQPLPTHPGRHPDRGVLHQGPQPAAGPAHHRRPTPRHHPRSARHCARWTGTSRQLSIGRA